MKMLEETGEVVKETAKLSRFVDEECGHVDDDALDDTEKRLAEELTDVITVCVSWLDALGYDEKARERLQAQVNEKNRKRGYHDEADS